MGLRVICLFALVAPLLGCGAKTGLGVQAAASDGGTDIADARLPDAGFDAAVVPPRLCGGADIVLRVDESGNVSPASTEIAFSLRLELLDVYFLFDTTGSMSGELRAMQRAVDSIIDGLACADTGLSCDAGCPATTVCGPLNTCVEDPEASGCVASVWVGAGSFAGVRGSYRNLQPPAAPSPEVFEALRFEADGFGGEEDLFRSTACAIDNAPSIGCPTGQCARDGFGCAGFRPTAVKVIVALTDEPDGCRLAGCVRAQVPGDVLRRNNVAFVGIDADIEGSATDDLTSLGVLSETVRADGTPYVYQGNDGAVVDRVNQGLREFLEQRPLTVKMVQSERDEAGSALDFLRGAEVSTSGGCSSGFETLDVDRDGADETFVDVLPGSRVCWNLRPNQPARQPVGAEWVTVTLQAAGAVLTTRTVCIEAL